MNSADKRMYLELIQEYRHNADMAVDEYKKFKFERIAQALEKVLPVECAIFAQTVLTDKLVCPICGTLYDYPHDGPHCGNCGQARYATAEQARQLRGIAVRQAAANDGPFDYGRTEMEVEAHNPDRYEAIGMARPGPRGVVPEPDWGWANVPDPNVPVAPPQPEVQNHRGEAPYYAGYETGPFVTDELAVPGMGTREEQAMARAAIPRPVRHNPFTEDAAVRVAPRTGAILEEVTRHYAAQDAEMTHQVFAELQGVPGVANNDDAVDAMAYGVAAARVVPGHGDAPDVAYEERDRYRGIFDAVGIRPEINHAVAPVDTRRRR